MDGWMLSSSDRYRTGRVLDNFLPFSHSILYTVCIVGGKNSSAC
jgi:hypothetical protein